MDEAKAQAAPVTYEDLYRNINSYNGKLLTIKCKVVLAIKELLNKGTYDVLVECNPALIDISKASSTSNFNPQQLTFLTKDKLMGGDLLTLYGADDGTNFWRHKPETK